MERSNTPNLDRLSAPDAGLCRTCRFVRLIRSARNVTYHRCERSDTEPSYPRFPRLPVVSCAGYQRSPIDTNGGGEPEDTGPQR